MKVVLIMFKGEERREFPIIGERITLGRRQECDLRIPTRDVSRQHCEVTLDGKRLSVRDLGSSNGTFVNGKRVAEIDLKAGDRLRVGPVTFVVQVDGKPAKIEPVEPSPAEIAPTAGPAGDEETFDLSEADFDLDDAMAAPDDDEDDMP
jgi:pSer/pThr/pTyr-binding forkhead associated (FHA) protein